MFIFNEKLLIKNGIMMEVIEIDKISKYMYLERQITINKLVSRRFKLNWAAFDKLYEEFLLAVAIYASKTWSLTKAIDEKNKDYQKNHG